MLDGSPRPARSNTGILLRRFAEGFGSLPGNDAVTLRLVRPREAAEAVLRFCEPDAVLLGFPLSMDAMPSLVKELVEALGQRPLPAARPRLLFLVQSGFPEATHTVPVARWLERLAARLGCPCAGVIRRGGVEGIQQYPAFVTQRLLGRFTDLGREFGRTGTLDPRRLARLAGPERVPALALRLGTWVSAAVLWNRPLRRSGAFARRFEAPYLEEGR
jgi:hypothetical protein